MRRCPIAKPAIVEMSRAIGTTPSTIVALDTSSVPMLAWLNAFTKLSHRGSAGHSMPSGIEPDGWRAVVNRLMNGRIVIAIRTIRRPRPNPQLATGDLHESDSRTRRWMGRIVTSTSSISTMASAEAVPTSRPTNARM